MIISQLAVNHYVPVAVETLRGAQRGEFDLFLSCKGSRPLLFRSRAQPLSDDDVEKLLSSGVNTLLIGTIDRVAYEEHLHGRVSLRGDLSAAGRYALLTGTARSVFESALRGEGVAGIACAAEEFGTQLADVLSDGRLILPEVFDLMLHDYCTFTHCANVATYCTGIARELGISDRAELARVAAGALLHDVGKRKISRRVLNAPQRLTAAEREIIQRHPQIGFEELSSDANLTWSQLMMVYQHHERLDGRGYPVEILADEIDPWAKICAVADVFDALTCDRPYRAALPVAAACEFLERRAPESFDPEIVRCLNTMLQPS